MKKLVIAAAIVCAAVMAEATCALSWKAGSSKAYVDSTGTEMETYAGLALVNLGSTIDWANAVAIDMITEDKTVEATTMAISNRGYVSGTVKWDWADGADNLVDNGDYLAVMAIDANGKLSKLSYYNDGDPTEVGNEAVYRVSGIENNSYSKTGAIIGLTGAYTTVPEPTSGLLLLLGVAGLALRRRRA